MSRDGLQRVRDGTDAFARVEQRKGHERQESCKRQHNESDDHQRERDQHDVSISF